MQIPTTPNKTRILLLASLFIIIPSVFSLFYTGQGQDQVKGKGRKKELAKDSLQGFVNSYIQLASTRDSLARQIILNREHLTKKINLYDSSESIFTTLYQDIEKLKLLVRSKRQQDSLVDIRTRQIQTYTSGLTGSRIISVRGVKYQMFIADLDKHKIRTHYIPYDKNGYSSIPNVLRSLILKRQAPLMITNAGMFTFSHQPEGLFIEEGSKTRFELDTGGNDPNLNFYLKPNGVFYIDGNEIPHVVTTEEMGNILKNKGIIIKCATQSGPMLLIDGKVHEAFKPHSKNLKIRSGVGIISQKKIVFIATADGENFYNFSVFFRDVFGCRDALFLDGAISRMYLHDLNPIRDADEFGPMISVTNKK